MKEHANKKQKTGSGFFPIVKAFVSLELLPPEILVNIFSFLDEKSLMNIANTNQSFNKLIHEESGAWQASLSQFPGSLFNKIRAAEDDKAEYYKKLKQNHKTAKAILDWLFNDPKSNDEDQAQSFRADWADFYEENLSDRKAFFVEIAQHIIAILDDKKEYVQNLNSGGKANSTVINFFALMGDINALELLLENGAILDKETIGQLVLKSENFSYELFAWLMAHGVNFGLDNYVESEFLKQLTSNFKEEYIAEDTFVNIVALLCYTESFASQQYASQSNISAILNVIFSQFRPTHLAANFSLETDEEFQYFNQVYQQIVEQIQDNFRQAAVLASSELKRNTMS